MKRNFSILLALSALVMTAGCKKDLAPNNASVNLAKPAKAGFVANTGWQEPPDVFGRLTRFDVGDANNSDCILSYDVKFGSVSLTKFSGTTSTTLYSYGDGFETDNAGVVPVNNWWSDITDNFNEVGGVHVIAYDATGSGHEDHILLYIPLRQLAVLMHYNSGSNLWHVDWPSGFSGTTVTGSGIGGYDLKGITDKIIAYDYGTGESNYLMLYRPGYKFMWVLNNNTTPSNPNPSGGITWSPRVQSTGGIGGYDLSNVNDQLVEIGGPIHDYMFLAAYRPGYGTFWVLGHSAGSISWYEYYSSSTGLNGFGMDKQDRIATGASGLGSPAPIVPEDDDNMFCYRPGSGIGTVPTSQSAFYMLPTYGSLGGPGYITFIGPNNSTQLLLTNPYGTQPTSPFDHVLFFSGGTDGSQFNSNMLYYSPGAGRQSQLYYLTGGGGGNNYVEEY